MHTREESVSRALLLPFVFVRGSPMTDGVLCPCRALATRQTWETHLYLCLPHAKEWLRCEEKTICDTAIEEGNDDAMWGAVNAFVARIGRKPPIWERVRSALASLRGVPS